MISDGRVAPKTTIENIPRELTARKQWVLWREETRDGKSTKVPYQASGRRADSTKPETWTTFSSALNAYLKKPDQYSGMGFVFSKDDPHAGVDLDKCLNPETGEIALWARKILDWLNSYAEISPSGKGVKVFLRGALPRDLEGETRNKKTGMGENGVGEIELYDCKRYFTVTGHHLDGYPTTIEDRDAELKAIHSEIFALSTNGSKRKERPSPEPLSLSDEEIIQKAHDARDGAEFSQLWAGDTTAYDGDDSRADLALCAMLAFWVGGDPTAIDRLFRQSGLCREKWRREDYRERTITRALEGMTEFYSPRNPFRVECNGAGPKAQEVEEETISLPAFRVEPFPVEVLPGSLARFVQEAAKALPCPPDFIGVPMLVMLGAAIGTSRVIQLKPGWTEGARFYVAVVADPGSRKSPALDLVAGPLRERQRELHEEYKGAKEIYRSEVSQFEVEMEAWKEANRKTAKEKGPHPGEKPDEPEEPVMAQVVTTDATLEALAVLLQQNPRGLVFLRDELTGWVHGMNQYKGGKGADRQAWLSFWNGAQVIVNRKSAKEPSVLDRPFVCVVGCLPPDVLSDLADERGREDGFVHRLLFAYPEHLPPFWIDASVSQEAQEGYRKVFKELLRLSPGVDEAGRPAPVVVTFTDEGRGTFIEWVNSHHKEQEDLLFPENLRGPWAKLEGYCARLALILQEARYVSGEAKSESVDAPSVEGAAALIDYFKSHARKVYSRLHVTKEDKQVELALAWIRKQGGKVTLREVLRYKVAGVKTKGEALQLLQDLGERGYGKIAEGEKKSLTFTLTT